MRRCFHSLLIASMLATLPLGTGCGSTDSTVDESVSSRGQKISLGSLATMVEHLREHKPLASRRYTFPIGAGANVDAFVETYDEEGSQISMTGRARDSEDSEFIVKVNGAGLYGWLVYHDRNVAWEYTTSSDGAVQAEKVPVEKIFPVCPIPPEEHPDVHSPEEPSFLFKAPDEFPQHARGFPGNSVDVTTLESRPESENVYYIDITDVMNGSEPRQGLTKEHLWVAWSIAAATHWQFDINVTTDPEVYETAGVSNTICSTVVWEDQGGRSSCGINAFGTRRCCNNKLYNDGYGTGRILNHEIGHGWGLGHDGGDNGGEYFNGFSEFEWTALMGNVWPGSGWPEPLYQWSKGEYDTATNQQDDFDVITRSVDYVEDDIPDSTPLIIEGTTLAVESNWGQIGRTTDTDSWTFEVAAGGGSVS